mmetsp:Transcript_9661/g.21780  ORF Transcript_9661/g.21780 Transcript_9661/m.21780 type:complete len:107 (+) Transcript_9661:121-441(+)
MVEGSMKFDCLCSCLYHIYDDVSTANYCPGPGGALPICFPALMTSSTSNNCDANTVERCKHCLFTRTLSQIPSSAGIMGSPEVQSNPTARVQPLSSLASVKLSIQS